MEGKARAAATKAADSHVSRTAGIPSQRCSVFLRRFFDGGRAQLWEEKLGLRAPFAGNPATRWGTRQEPAALAR